MKLEIKSEKEVPLLSRKRVKMKAVFEKETPSRDAVKKEAAKALKTKEELTVIKHIYPAFGRKEAKVIAHIYKNADDMKSIEEEHLLKKHLKDEKKGEQPQEAAEAAAEAPKEEAKAEEKKAD